MTSGILKQALQEVERSSHEQFKISAVIFKGPRILSSGVNGIRSCSKINKKFQEYENSLHAEQSCILNARRDLKGTSMLVLRVNKHGEFRMAKPCEMCRGFIEAVGIKEIYYTTSTGEIAYERVGMN